MGPRKRTSPQLTEGPIMASDKSATRLPRVIPLAAVLAALFLAPCASAATGDAWDGNWHGSFSIYGWLPGVDAELGIPVDTGGLPLSSKM